MGSPQDVSYCYAKLRTSEGGFYILQPYQLVLVALSINLLNCLLQVWKERLTSDHLASNPLRHQTDPWYSIIRCREFGWFQTSPDSLPPSAKHYPQSLFLLVLNAKCTIYLSHNAKSCGCYIVFSIVYRSWNARSYREDYLSRSFVI